MRCSIASAALLILPCGAVAQPVLQNLGTLGGGLQYSSATAISADGLVVTGSSSSPTGDRGFRWSVGGGAMQSIGLLPSGQSTEARAINADGSVIVGTGYMQGGASSRAFRWTSATGCVDLGILAGAGPHTGSGVSGDGSVAAGTQNSLSAGGGAFSWTSGGGGGGGGGTLVSLATMTGMGGSIAYAVSGNGQVIVGSSPFPGLGLNTYAFRWNGQAGGTGGGTLERLGTLLSGTLAESEAYAVSSDGTFVAGSSRTGNSSLSAVRWSGNTIQNLGVLPGGTAAYGWCISGDGRVVGGQSNSSLGQRAFVWTQSLGMVDLNAYLPTLGVNLTGWSLTRVAGLSGDGTRAAGYGQFNGATRAWYLSGLPFAPPCPADVGVQGGVPGQDGVLDNNDFIAFINLFFAMDPLADRGVQGGVPGSDGLFDNNDFIVFINQFFAGC